MMAVAGWNLGYLLSILTYKYIIITLIQVFIVSVAPLFAHFEIGYAGLEDRLRRYVWIFWVLPTLAILLIATNNLHHLYWLRMDLVEASRIEFVVLIPGPALWLKVVGSYITILTGIAVLCIVFSLSIGDRSLP